jgi:hypothetical protein
MEPDGHITKDVDVMNVERPKMDISEVEKPPDPKLLNDGGSITPIGRVALVYRIRKYRALGQPPRTLTMLDDLLNLVEHLTYPGLVPIPVELPIEKPLGNGGERIVPRPDNKVETLCVDTEPKRISDIVSPDAPTTTNEKGGSQSDIPVRFDLIDGPAMFEMAKVLGAGAKKYGDDNWRLVPVEDHLNHLLMHTFAYLSGDATDDHLSHILCRATFALGVQLKEES